MSGQQPAIILPVIGPAFKMGISLLEPKDWLKISPALPNYLAQKQILLQSSFDAIFAAKPDTKDAQTETYELITQHLRDQHPAIAINASEHPKLLAASLLIEDDLVIMRRDDEGWRLVAAALFFPSSWRLKDKFGLILDDVHGPVPGFHAGTRNADLITRMFDNLQVGAPVIRSNWSIYSDDHLRHETSHSEGGSGFDLTQPILPQAFMRSERQTLTKMEKSSAILFTIRIGTESLLDTIKRGDGYDLRDALTQMTAEQLAYKGLQSIAPKLMEEIKATA